VVCLLIVHFINKEIARTPAPEVRKNLASGEASGKRQVKPHRGEAAGGTLMLFRGFTAAKSFWFTPEALPLRYVLFAPPVRNTLVESRGFATGFVFRTSRAGFLRDLCVKLNPQLDRNLNYSKITKTKDVRTVGDLSN
jgi:hypothetical protein